MAESLAAKIVTRDQVYTDMEYSLLSILLRNPKKIGQAVTLIDPEDFEQPNRDIFATMRELFLQGKPVDSLTVTAASDFGDEGRTYIQALMDQKASVSENMLQEYCSTLRNLRRLEQAKTAALSAFYAKDLDSVAKGLDDLNRLMVERKGLKAVDAPEMVNGFWQRLEQAKNRKFLEWGMPALDGLIFAEPGDYIVLGGYPSAGKTALAAQIALHIAQKQRVGFFSLETKEPKLTDRMMSYLAQVPLEHIKTGILTEREYRALGKAAEDLWQRQLKVIPAAGATVQDIQAETLAERFQVIFVDYMQLISIQGKNRYEKVTEISLQLHTLAQAHGVTLIALAQLSRPKESEGGKGKLIPPSMSSFRESGQIEQDADVGMIIYPSNPNDNRSQRILKVAKNKEGRKESITLDFNGDTQTLTEGVEPPRKKDYRDVKKKDRRVRDDDDGQEEMQL